ncbi:hypothetical protein [Paenibacillus sinopodophylli]|uniref:hypothetical protein n=1 Tax=Paenibacillus sinopodophylli TaxID=1837342 RepID=UPI00110CEA61|nr:hypothetical protein [Paenibacillus sinopodophylli]
MPGTYDGQIRKASVLGSKEIKASAHYQVMPVGGTLDGTKFAAGALILEGQCLVREKATKKYVPYNAGGVVDAAGNIPTTHDNPVILDQSIKFTAKDDGSNPDVIFGQALIVGAVYEGQLIGFTAGFKAATPQIRYVSL